MPSIWTLSCEYWSATKRFSSGEWHALERSLRPGRQIGEACAIYRGEVRKIEMKTSSIFKETPPPNLFWSYIPHFPVTFFPSPLHGFLELVHTSSPFPYPALTPILNRSKLLSALWSPVTPHGSASSLYPSAPCHRTLAFLPHCSELTLFLPQAPFLFLELVKLVPALACALHCSVHAWLPLHSTFQLKCLRNLSWPLYPHPRHSLTNSLLSTCFWNICHNLKLECRVAP